MADIWSRLAERYDFLYSPWPRSKGAGGKVSLGISTREAVRAVHSYPDAWEEVRSEGGAIRYVLSYVSKPYQKTVPLNYSNVGRFWGTSRFPNREEGIELHGTEEDVRELAADVGRDFTGWDLLPRVIFYR